MLRKEIGLIIKAHIVRHGMVQKELCEQHGIDKSAFSRVTNGHNKSLDVLNDVCRATGLVMSEVVAEAEATVGNAAA